VTFHGEIEWPIISIRVPLAEIYSRNFGLFRSSSYVRVNTFYSDRYGSPFVFTSTTDDTPEEWQKIWPTTLDSCVMRGKNGLLTIFEHRGSPACFGAIHVTVEGPGRNTGAGVGSGGDA
jgi:hypothetical protein